jgi:hypothetical protein
MESKDKHADVHEQYLLETKKIMIQLIPFLQKRPTAFNDTLRHLLNELLLQDLKNEDQLTMLFTLLQIENSDKVVRIQELIMKLVLLGRSLSHCFQRSNWSFPKGLQRSQFD